MPRRSAKAVITAPPAPERTTRRSPEVDAEMIAACREATAEMIRQGWPRPGLVSLVEIAIGELERFYAADMIAPR